VNYLTTPNHDYTRAANNGPPGTEVSGGTLCKVEEPVNLNRIVGPVLDVRTKKIVTLLDGTVVEIPWNTVLYIDAKAKKVKSVSSDGGTVSTEYLATGNEMDNMNYGATCSIMGFYNEDNAVYWTAPNPSGTYTLYRYSRTTDTLTTATPTISCDYSDMHQMVGVKHVMGSSSYERVYIATGKNIRRYNKDADTMTTLFSQPYQCSPSKDCYVYAVAYSEVNSKIYFSFGGNVKRMNLDGSDVETVYTAVQDAGQTNKKIIWYAFQVDSDRDVLYASGYPDGLYLSIRCIYRLDLTPTTLGTTITIAETEDDRYIDCYAGGQAAFAAKGGDTLMHMP
jgi:hypothetical protein